MFQHDFLCIGQAAAAALALTLAAIPATASAATPFPIDLVADDDSIAIDDEPFCPTCYDDPPSELVAENDTAATLVLSCDHAVGEPLQGTLVVEVELNDGTMVRIHREPGFELCVDGTDPEYETTLYAGPGWTWHAAVMATVSVVED